MRDAVFLVSLLGIGACSGDDGGGIGSVEIAVSDHQDALTTNSNDNLFVLELTASDRAFAPSEIEVTGSVPGQSGVILRFDHTDGDGNGLIDVGETLTGREPPANRYDETTVGQDIEVDFNEDDGAVLRRLAGAIWTPAN